MKRSSTPEIWCAHGCAEPNCDHVYSQDTGRHIEPIESWLRDRGAKE